MEESFIVKLQAMLDKVKSIANIKKNIKSIEPKLKIKLQGILDKTVTKKELNTTLKTIKPKIKVDADTSQALKKIKKLGKHKTTTIIQPTVDNSQVISSLKDTQKETKSLFDRFLNGAVGVNLVRMSVQKVTQAIYQAITGLKELDKIKTDIQMVSGTSDSGVDAMMRSYNAMAKELSSTTKSVSEAANEFLRMGESVANTNELIKSSQVLSKVGMIESSEAASYLISSLKGYKVAAEDSLDIVSKLTSVDLEAAVSAGGLAEAMSRCSNIANSSGTSMDRLIGYMAAAGEVTQDSMSVIGNSFKSIFSRMNNIKIGRFIDDETGESLSDTEAVLNKLGIQLRDTEDSYRNFDDVLDDVGTRWKDFSQVEQNAVSVAMAGTMQRERFVALMNNYSSALKYSEVAANSAGSAMQRYGMYQDSIEGKTNELTAAIESLSTNTISEDLYSGIIVATTNIVQFIDKMGILKGTLAGFVAMGISKTFVSMATGIVSAAKSTAQLATAMALFKNGRSEENLLAIGAACKGLNDKQLKLLLSTKGLKEAQRLQILTGMGVAESEREQTLATLGFATAEGAATGATFTLNGALRALWATMCANPIGVIFTVVSVVTMVFSAFSQKAEEAIQSAKDSADAYKEISSSMDDYISKYSELRKQLIAAKGNEEETYNVKKQMLDLQTDLNEKYGEEHGYLNLVTDAYKDQTKAIKELNKESANKFLHENEQGINDAERNMESDRTYNLSYAIAKTGDNEKVISELVEKYKKDGMSILDAGESFYIKLDADPKDAYETINSFMTDVQDKAKALGNGNLFKDTVTSAASISLNKAKETLDSHQETYNQAKMAQIASDDNLSEGYDKAVSAVEAYNEAILRSEDPYNDENVNKAWNDLQTVKQGIQENKAEWGKYSSVMEDVFSAANDDVYSFYQALQDDTEITKLAGKLKGLSDVDLQAMADDGSNGDAFDILYAKAEEYGLEVQDLIDLLVKLGYVQGEISKEAQNTQPLSFKEAWASLDTTEDDSLKSLKDDLLSLAEAGKLTLDAFNETKGSDTFLSQLGIEPDDTEELKELIDTINKLKTSADQLSSMKKGISALSENLYNKQQEPGKAIDADVLAGMDEGLKEQTAEWEKYEAVMGSASSTMEEVQKATDDLATAYIQSNNFLANLTESKKDYYVSQLKSMGVANAEEIVQSSLAEKYETSRIKEEALKIVKDGVTDATISEVEQLLQEEGAAYGVRAAVMAAVEAERIFAATDLGITEKISQMEDLINTAYGAAAAIEFASLTGGYDDKGNKLTNGMSAEEAYAKISAKYTTIKPIEVNQGGSSARNKNGSGGSKGTDKAKENTVETFNFIETAIARLEKAIDRLKDKTGETFRTFKSRAKAYRNEISKITEEITLQGQAYEKYIARADSVKLEEAYASQVRDGSLNIEDVSDDGLKERIKNYKEW